MSTDINSKMLFALVDHGVTASKLKIPLDDQKRYLKRNIDSVTIDDRKAIGNVLLLHNKKSALCMCAEGTLINLDAMPIEIVEQMYTLLMYQMTKRI